MTVFVQLVITGIAMGSVYGLVALAFALLVNTVNILNFSQGEFLMLGAFVAYSCAAVGLPFWVSVLIAVIAVGTFGVVFERTAVRPVRRGDVSAYLVSTLAASVVLRNLAQHIFGAAPVSYTAPFDQRRLRLDGLVLNPQDLLVVGATVALMAGLYVFLFHTRAGRQMRATAQDRETARLIGVRVERVSTLTFVLAGGIGALAGVLVAPIYFVSFDMGFSLGLKGFVATIIGGWGSIPGAMVGGLLVGLSEVLAAAYISSVYKDVFAFAILVLFLLFLPRGVFGERVAQRV